MSFEQVASLGGPPVEVLKVSSKSNPNACAGALAGVLRQEGVVEVQVVGAGALNQAIKAVAIARGFVAPSGLDLICIPTFADIEIDGENRTAIRLLLEDRHRRNPLTLDMRPVDLDNVAADDAGGIDGVAAAAGVAGVAGLAGAQEAVPANGVTANRASANGSGPAPTPAPAAPAPVASAVTSIAGNGPAEPASALATD